MHHFKRILKAFSEISLLASEKRWQSLFFRLAFTLKQIPIQVLSQNPAFQDKPFNLNTLRYILICISLLPFCLIVPKGHALEGILTENQIIESSALGYSLQYRAYLPPQAAQTSNLPTLYITDGQWYISEGRFHTVMDTLIAQKKIKPIIAIFLDSSSPGNKAINLRQKQFFCVYEYVDFFRDELVPHISETFPVSQNRTDRTILGLSFGGLNAACFGLMATDLFEGIAMQSPAFQPVPQVYDYYQNNTRRALNIFMSIGRDNDNTREGRRFRDILKEKGYRLKYIENRHGHNWRNWKPLLDDILLHYFSF